MHENFAHGYSRAQSDMTSSIQTQNAYCKWNEGTLAPEPWRGWEFVPMNLFSTPAGKDFWSERSYLFADAFQSFVVEDIMTRSPHPQARAWGAFNLSE